MAKRLNKKLVVALSLVGFSVMIGLSALMIAQLSHRDPKNYVKLAIGALAQKEYQGAANYYQRAFRASQNAQHPKGNAQYLVDKGEVLLDGGLLGEALSAWNSAITADPTLFSAYRRRLEVLLRRAEIVPNVATWSEVRSAAERLLGEERVTENMKDLEHAFARHALGQALVRLDASGEPGAEGGFDELVGAIELAPDVLKYTLDLADFHLHPDRGELEEGEKLLKGMLAKFSLTNLEIPELELGEGGSFEQSAVAIRLRYVQFLDDKADRLTQEGKTEEAQSIIDSRLEYLDDAIDLAGENVAAWVDAKLAYALHLSQEWVTQLNTSPSDPSLDEAFDEIKEIYLACIEQQPESFEPYLRLATAYKLAFAREMMLAKNPALDAAARTEALALAQEHAQDAIEICEQRLEPLREGFSRTGLDGLLTKVNVFELSLSAAESAWAASTTVPPSEGDQWLNRARDFLESALAEFNEDPRALSQLGRIEARSGRDRKALGLFHKADQRFTAQLASGSVPLTYLTKYWDNSKLLAETHLQLGQAGQAVKVLEAVLKQPRRPEDLGFWLLSTQVLMAAGDYPGALRFAQTAARMAPASDQVKRQLVLILSHPDVNRPAEADLVARELPSDHPLRRIAEDPGGFGSLKPLEILQQALADDPTNLRTLQQMFNRFGPREEVKEAVARARDLKPDDVEIGKLYVLTAYAEEDQATERDREWLALLSGQDDEYLKARDLAVYHKGKKEFDLSLKFLDEAAALLLARSTPATENAGSKELRILLATKMQVGSELLQSKDASESKRGEEILEEVRDDAIEHDVDGAGGETFVGQYHMYLASRDPQALTPNPAELVRAITAFEKALIEQPFDARTLAHLGLCRHYSLDPQQAQIRYEEALESNPNEWLAHKGLARIAAQQGDQAKLDLHLNACARLMQSNLALRADRWVTAQLEAREPDKAIASREEALRSAEEAYAQSSNEPNRQKIIDHLASLVQLYTAVQDWAGAEKSIIRALELDPNNVAWVKALHANLFTQGQFEHALKILMDYVGRETDPNRKIEASLIIAAHHLQQKDRTLALKALEEAEALGPQTPAVLSRLAQFHMAGNQSTRARRYFERWCNQARPGAGANLRDALAGYIVCLLDRSVDDLDEATAVVKEYLDAFPGDARGLFLKAAMHARGGQIDQAIRALDDSLLQQPDYVDARLRLAGLHLSQGNNREAIAQLLQIKRINPAFLEGRTLLAGIYRSTGREEDAFDELRSLAEDFPDSDAAAIPLFMAYQAAERLGPARSLATKWKNLKQGTQDPRWHFYLGDIKAKLGNADDALADYRDGVEEVDFAGYAVERLLRKHLVLGRAQGGLEYFTRNESRIQPNWNAGVLSSLGALLSAQGRSDDAVRRFRQAADLAIKKNDRSVGQVYGDILNSFGPDAASRFVAPPPSAALTHANGRLLFGLYSLDKARHQDALDLLAKLLEDARDDEEKAVILSEEGMLYEVAEDYTEAARAYRNAIAKNGSYYPALNNLAYNLAEHLGQPREALKFAQTAAEILPTEPAILDTLGWVYVLNGDYDRAIGELTQVRVIKPDHCEAQYHLGEAYRRKGDFAGATRILDNAANCAGNVNDTKLAIRIRESQQKVNARDDNP